MPNSNSSSSSSSSFSSSSESSLPSFSSSSQVSESSFSSSSQVSSSSSNLKSESMVTLDKFTFTPPPSPTKNTIMHNFGSLAIVVLEYKIVHKLSTLVLERYKDHLPKELTIGNYKYNISEDVYKYAPHIVATIVTGTTGLSLGNAIVPVFINSVFPKLLVAAQVVAGPLVYSFAGAALHYGMQKENLKKPDENIMATKEAAVLNAAYHLEKAKKEAEIANKNKISAMESLKTKMSEMNNALKEHNVGIENRVANVKAEVASIIATDEKMDVPDVSLSGVLHDSP